MNVSSLFRGAGSVLVIGILAILIGVLFPDSWSSSQLFREVGVVVTFMGTVGMIAQLQNARDAQQLLPRTDAQLSSDT
jgi:hypothetical protein